MGEAVEVQMACSVDAGEVADQWYRRGFSCDVHTDPAGKEWAECVHDNDELIMVVEGDVELRFKDESHRLRPGVEYLVPACRPHRILNTGNTRCRWLFGYSRDYASTD